MWRFGKENEALASKFGEGERGWVPSKVSRYKRFGCRGVIPYHADVSSSSGDMFSNGVGFRIGIGSRVQF